MKKISKIFSVLLVLALLPLAACTPSGGQGGDTGGDATEAPIPRVDLTGYTVVRPDTAGQECIQATVALFSTLSGVCEGIKVETDWKRADVVLPESAKEILVGATNRPESAAAAEGLKENDYAIRYFPESGRIAIVGGGEAGTVRGVEAFAADYLASPDADGKYSVPETLNLIEREKYDVENLTLCGKNIYEYTLVVPEKADRDEKYAALLIAEAVRAATGVCLTTVGEKNAPDGAKIFIGAVTDLPQQFRGKGADGGYVLGLSDAGILVAGEGGMTVRAAREFISLVLPEGSTGVLDCTLPVAALTAREKTDYPALPELGEMPVALTDQKNACAVVYDFAAALKGETYLPLWTFKPTSKLGFDATSGYANRIDEAKLRFSPTLGKYVVCVTSSSGFVGVAEYPSGECVWNVDLSGYGPHSIDYLPDGNVALALSGNGNEDKAMIRVYAASQGKNAKKYTQSALTSAHAVAWDDVREVLWALGSSEIVAYEIGGTPDAPKLTKIGLYGVSQSMGGHDMSPVFGDTDKMWVCGSGAFVFDKASGTVTKVSELSSGSSKTLGAFENGTVIRTVAANVYASHDTNAVDVFLPDGTGKYEHKVVLFPDADRAFYKARIFLPFYS